MKNNFARALVEICFIIFLFYSNLLMGEFERSGNGEKFGILWSLHDIFTIQNFLLASFAALVGYVVFEFLRNRY